MRKNLSEVEEPPSSPLQEKPVVRAMESADTSSKNIELSSNILKRFIQKALRALLSKPKSLEEDVAELLDEHDPEGQKLGNEERELVNNILGLGNKTVHDVMIPRSDIIAVNDTMTLPELKQAVLTYEHTRMPVYKETLDQVTGFLHIKDIIPLFGSSKSFIMSNIVREVLFVPPSMRITDLLLRMKERRVHMAIVLDEYGGTEGLVTMEDIMEEIIGDIEDEHDDISESDCIALDEHSYQMSARIHIDDFVQHVGIPLTNDVVAEDYDTLGGFLFYLLGRIPEKGEIIEHDMGLSFEILDADPRHIKKVLVRKLPSA